MSGGGAPGPQAGNSIRNVRRPVPEGDGEVHRILLIEDDAGDALLVEELLADTELQFVLHWTQTLADALADLAQRAADCVLLDLHLPDASGTPFISAVQAASPGAAVIVLTGLADSGAGARAVANGAQDYLLKGQIDAALLHRSILYAVQRKQAESAGAELRENQIRAQENRRLERGLLPAPLLDSPRFTATTRYLPAREGGLLGGDFLDVVQVGDHTVHAIIGDVSGHGPDEAALGVCLRIAWRALTLAGHTGIGLLNLLEQVMVAERPSPGMFATCNTATLDLASGRATVFLAGHHEPLLTRPGAAERIPARHGMALGIMPGRRSWHPTELDLPESGALLLYTDGLFEGYAGPGDDRLGVNGLIDLIAAAPSQEAEPMLDHLMATVRGLNAERHADDLAILRLAWHGERSAPAAG
jgi:serine phosphatase RsbU (regulator of sigma subunit)